MDKTFSSFNDIEEELEWLRKNAKQVLVKRPGMRTRHAYLHADIVRMQIALGRPVSKSLEGAERIAEEYNSCVGKIATIEPNKSDA